MLLQKSCTTSLSVIYGGLFVLWMFAQNVLACKIWRRSFDPLVSQMKRTVTRRRKASVGSVCSIWTEPRNSRNTWKTRTNRARNQWRKHRAMTSMRLALIYSAGWCWWMKSIAHGDELCVCTEVTVTAKEKILRQRSSRSIWWVSLCLKGVIWWLFCVFGVTKSAVLSV